MRVADGEDPQKLQQDIDAIASRSSVAKTAYERYLTCQKLGAGDIVLEYYMSGRYNDKTNTWSTVKAYTENVSGSGIPARFKVVAVDNEGRVYARKILLSGKPGKIFCLQYSLRSYELDPHYVDSLLLNAEYDATEAATSAKQHKEHVREYNKSIAHCFSTHDEAKEWFINNIKPGQTIWVLNDLIPQTPQYSAFTVSRIEKRRLNNNWMDSHVVSKDGTTLTMYGQWHSSAGQYTSDWSIATYVGPHRKIYFFTQAPKAISKEGSI